MVRAKRTWGRAIGALPLILLAMTALASASIQVNKAFAPNSVALGAQSTVTVTLQNSSTASPATITAFSDDIGTMAGHATLLTSPAPTTTCPGGTPSIAGQVISMNNGQIPQAPSASVPGSCTITFKVVGNAIGNGFNTIAAANVVTSLGSPSADVTQTLAVQTANVTATSISPGSVQIGDTTTVKYVITNPTAVALTNATFPITSNATATYTLAAFTTSCGGTATLPPAGTTGTATFSGLTIPASGACTVTLDVTTPNTTTVNFTLPAGGVADDQGATNATGVSAQARFLNGKPNITKSFAPNAVTPGSTTTLTINVQNVLTDKPLTNAAFSDTLPASLTITSIAENANCGGATLGGVGTATLNFSAGTIATNSTCTVTVTVNVPAGQPAGQVTNTIPTASFTSTEVSGSAAIANANLLVTGAGGGVSTSKSATPNAAGVNTPFKITLNFNSLAGGAFTGGTLTDNLPQSPVAMIGIIDGTHPVTFTGCGAAPTFALGGPGGNTAFTASNMTIAAGGTCTVSFYAEFPNATSASRVDTNQLLAANVSFTGSAGPVSPAGTVSANITELPTLSVTNYQTSNSGLKNQPLTVQAVINDPSGTADTSAVAVINLTAGKVALAANPNFTFTGCPAGVNASSITIAGNREQFTVNIGAINASCTIGYDVIDEGGVVGTFTPANPTYTSTLTGGVAVAYTGQNNVTFATTTINVTKAFAPNQIQAGGTSTADIALTVPQAGTLAKTQANGVAFSDVLPANVSFSPTPNVTFGPGCQQGGQPAPGFSIAGGTISFSNISLVTNGTVQTTCDVKFDVTSSVVGAPLNQIGAGAITSTSGITNTQIAKASLTVNAGLGVAKTFVSPTLQIGGTDYVRFLITNSTSSSALTGGTLVDAMPAALALASTTLGPTQAGDPALCGGAVAGPVGTGTLNLSGLSVPGSTGPATPGQCVAYVLVGASPSAAPGNAMNIVAVGGLNAGGFSNQTSTSANVTLTAPPAPTITKNFLPAGIAPSATSQLTITIDNTVAGAAPLSGMALTDSLPAGITVASTPNASTTCGAGTVTATAGSASVALAGASVAANATCTITVTVTGATAGNFVNTIPASALTDTQGATNAAPATATLTIAAAVSLSKAFSPATIQPNTTSTLTITIPNTAAGAVALSGMALTDALPAGITVAASPNAATTCGAGTVTATAGSGTVLLAAGTLAANATCTITVSVTGSAPASYVNTIPASALTTTQGVTNAGPASAGLLINPPGVALTKIFAPATIPSGGTSTLTIAIPNTAVGAVALTGMALSDPLPPGITVAATPNATTTCAGGTVTATAGAGSVSLAGGTLAANATCTISVSVTGTAAGGYLNLIAANALSTTQGVTNASSASANLTINPPGLTLVKAFSPTTILVGGTSALTITVSNTAPGAIALSGMVLSDALPAGTTVAATPNAATTCGAGTVTAATGATSVTLSGGSLAANATCTITVSVTGSTPGGYVNTIPANAMTTTQSVTNAAPATATLTVNPASTTLTKSFSPTAIPAGGTSTLTITIPNTGVGAIALSGMALTDALPAGITVAATPNAATTCGTGTVTAAAGATSVTLGGGSLTANATCTISVQVTGTVAGGYVNLIPANTLTTTQGVTNPSSASANLTINLNGIALTKAFAPATMTAGGTSTLTITIPNTRVGAVALSGMSLTDPLPAGITIAATPNAATTCGAGTVTAAAGATSVALSGASLAANATCTITVSVTGTVAGGYVNTIPANAVSTTQGVTNPAPASANLTINLNAIAVAKSFSPSTIPAGGTSTLTIVVPNTGTGAVALSGMVLSDVLPAGLTIAAAPNAATTCGAGTLTATAGGTSVALANGSVAANASCTITVSVTGTAAASYTNTIPASALSTAQGVSNAAPASASLTIILNGITLSKAFSPATIPSGGTSTLTITIPNSAVGAVPLTAVALTDALPPGVTIAATPNAATTCGTGTVNASAGGTSVALVNGALAASATCTISVNVTGTVPATYTNTIPSNALTTAQGVTNPVQTTANLTIVAVNLSVTKSSNPGGATVSPGQTIAYTITVTNSGLVAETNAKITDTLANAQLVAGSVKVNGNAAPDAVVASAAPFGTIAAGATATITYSATVDPSASAGTQVTNSATAAGDVPCTGTGCTAASNPDTVQPPVLSVSKTIDNGQGESVVPGQTVTYTMTVKNTGASPAIDVVLTDPVPSGMTPLPGTVTIGGATASGATVNGQTVTVPLGTIAAGTAAVVTFRAQVGAGIAGRQTNVVTVGATGTKSTIASNPVVALVVPPTLQVTKTAGATAVRVGDRIDYTITISRRSAVAFGATTVVDTLPAYEVYAAGTARVNGTALEPVVRGRTLTWVLPTLGSGATIAYATAIAAGAPQNATLTNVVDVTAVAPGGGQPGRGHASAQVLTIASTFGACYPITGRVYVDRKASGRFEDGDAGVAGVTIYLDDGESVVTDANGRYNFPCVRPGMHALRLDETTLPNGVIPFNDRNIDSEKSTRRLVHRTFDTTIIEDVNFGLSGGATTPEQQR